MNRTLILLGVSLGVLLIGGCGKGEPEPTGPEPLSEAERTFVDETFEQVLRAIEDGRPAEAEELLTALEKLGERLPEADRDRLARYREQCARAGGDEALPSRLPDLPER